MTKATPELIAKAKIGELYLEIKARTGQLDDARNRMAIAEHQLIELLNERRNKSKLPDGSKPDS